ncbi:DUF3997 domain-containing protein [Peribacillus sp. NPDC097284]|uniref:DUF3997 domain-containing protein n=1 Tax=Peribacillus sp. NPDC097284 TaxID=3364401 RepID=UPI0038017CB6
MQIKLFRYLLLSLLSLLFLTGCPGPSDYDMDLPGGYSVIKTSADEVKIAPKVSEGSWGTGVIPAKVTEVAWDDKYIIAKQLGLKNDDNGYQIPDEKNVSFWILEMITDEVTGPLDGKSFTEKKAEFGISNDIVLQEIDDIRGDG